MNKDSQTHAIIGAAMEVHCVLGPGFLEAVYQEALAAELQSRGIPFRREVTLPIYYKQQMLTSSYRADFFCFESVVVELKALNKLVSEHHAQIINQLKASSMERGLLLNFGASSLEYKRFIHQTQNLRQSAKSADCISLIDLQEGR